jgi:hypothetical protein
LYTSRQNEHSVLWKSLSKVGSMPSAKFTRTSLPVASRRAELRTARAGRFQLARSCFLRTATAAMAAIKTLGPPKSHQIAARALASVVMVT